MMTVASHAEPTPTNKMQSNHDCGVGSGSLACQRSKTRAATTDTANCTKRIREL